ncbi:MAG: hypothetical protein IRZ16_15090 [Myxococcaceae bacterium]|nr:hypothetical protein [Myxococcaceae bacterium]
MRTAMTAGRGNAGRILVEQPERLAAAWRRERYSERGGNAVPENLLDGCVETLIRELGHSLMGAKGPAWCRARGVLRLSLARGEHGLHQEFATLRRCLFDALVVANATGAEHHRLLQEIDAAAESAIALLRRLANPGLPLPRFAFGGLVIELIEPQPRHATGAETSWAPPPH